MLPEYDETEAGKKIENKKKIVQGKQMSGGTFDFFFTRPRTRRSSKKGQTGII